MKENFVIDYREQVLRVHGAEIDFEPLLSECVAQELEKMLLCKVIQPSTSPWSSPVVLIEKPNGEYRFCVNYRQLNAVTKKDAYLLPRIDVILDALGNATVFTTLDLQS